MSSKPFSHLPPSASSSIKPFTISFPDSDLQHMLDLLKLTPIASQNYENSLPNGDRHLGLRHDWLTQAKKYWETTFSWRDCEKRINEFPHFMAQVEDELGMFDVHFTALFSKREDAIPILLLHGWPGSFLEFLGMMRLLREKYDLESLPYHFVVPSLPGYTLSSAQPRGKDFSQIDCARVMHLLATKVLGFQKYFVQGGDVGSRVARVIGATYPECIGVHLNFCVISEPAKPVGSITSIEEEGLKRLEKWRATGSAYAQEHATRPATIGFVLSSSPLALLAWIGEKFQEWTEKDPDLDTILESVTLYWLTKCAHTNIWSYRHSYGPNSKPHDHPDWYLKKSFGYSYFPFELIPIPCSWVATTGDMVFSRVHDHGGHFAAMEQPKALLEDVEEFVKVALKGEGSKQQ